MVKEPVVRSPVVAKQVSVLEVAALGVQPSPIPEELKDETRLVELKEELKTETELAQILPMQLMDAVCAPPPLRKGVRMVRFVRPRILKEPIRPGEVIVLSSDEEA